MWPVLVTATSTMAHRTGSSVGSATTRKELTMKRIAWVGILSIALGATVMFAGSVWAAEQAKGEAITATGEVVDLWCYLDHEGRGAKHKECAVTCAKAGNPIGLVTEKADVYVLMGGEKHQPGSAVALDKMAETVTVAGTLIKKGGVQAIYVTEVK
jgi:hypothetical protein